jgi:RNA polymerase sigma-B factor
LREQLDELGRCADPVEQRRRRGQVIAEYMPVARSVAARYRGRGVEHAELEQLAYVGLVKAANRWQPGRSEDFLSFAVPTMVGEIKRFFRDHTWLIRPPRSIQEIRPIVVAEEERLRQRCGGRPSDAAVAAAAGISDRQLREVRSATFAFRPPSIQDADRGVGVVGGDPAWLGEDPELSRVEDRVTVQRLLATLTDEERRIIELRFHRGWSQARIGEEMGVSQMQVSRLLHAIFNKLRTVMQR